MKLLDLFCGVGGAALGYHRAGFDVIGVDIEPQPNYPFKFIQDDALTFPLDGFDVIHASPPCQVFTRAKHLRAAQGGESKALNLIPPIRRRLQGLQHSGRKTPWVIENVPGAPLRDPVTLCGSSFGLRVRRHRLFESNASLRGSKCDHKRQGRPIGVYHVMNDRIPQGGRTARTLREGWEAMGLPGPTWEELKEAIPPAYTLYLGVQLIGEV